MHEALILSATIFQALLPINVSLNMPQTPAALPSRRELFIDPNKDDVTAAYQAYYIRPVMP